MKNSPSQGGTHLRIAFDLRQHPLPQRLFRLVPQLQLNVLDLQNVVPNNQRERVKGRLVGDSSLH